MMQGLLEHVLLVLSKYPGEQLYLDQLGHSQLGQ